MTGELTPVVVKQIAVGAAIACVLSLAAVGLGVLIAQVRIWFARRQGDERWG